MKHVWIFTLLIILGASGCEAPQTPNKQEVAVKSDGTKASEVISKVATTVKNEAYKPFYVYADKGSRDNHYVPSGFMPNGECVTFTDTWLEGCHLGSTCMKIEYDVECSRLNQKWAGIYWLNPPNNWGSKKGGFDLTGATKLTFWAKGKEGGEQIQEVTMGGITGNYPDSDTALIGPIILSDQWKKYTIDLRGKDLSYISGGFAWTTSEDVNEENCTFYIDEVRYE